MTVFLCVVTAHTNATDRPPQPSEFSLDVSYSCVYKANFVIFNIPNAYRRHQMTSCDPYVGGRGMLFAQELAFLFPFSFVVRCNLIIRDYIICVLLYLSILLHLYIFHAQYTVFSPQWNYVFSPLFLLRTCFGLKQPSSGVCKCTNKWTFHTFYTVRQFWCRQNTWWWTFEAETCRKEEK
jgi:hypothetical protein